MTVRPNSTTSPNRPVNRGKTAQKKDFIGSFGGSIKNTGNFFKNLGPGGYFVIWFMLIFIAGLLIWTLSANLRLKLLEERANEALAEIGHSTALKEALSSWGLPEGASLAGTWFLTNENNLAVVWNAPYDGLLVPYLTLFSNSAEPELTLPLTKTAELFAQRAPNGAPELWTERIWQAARAIKEIN